MTRRLTVAQAADQFEAADEALAKAKRRREEAADVLKSWFRKTGRSSYKDRIGYSKTTRTVLDTGRVKLELGDRVPEFERDVVVEAVSRLRKTRSSGS